MNLTPQAIELLFSTTIMDIVKSESDKNNWQFNAKDNKKKTLLKKKLRATIKTFLHSLAMMYRYKKQKISASLYFNNIEWVCDRTAERSLLLKRGFVIFQLNAANELTQVQDNPQ